MGIRLLASPAFDVQHPFRSVTALLFDEAHNLVRLKGAVIGEEPCWACSGILNKLALFAQESICADAASFDLPAAHLAACIQEVRVWDVAAVHMLAQSILRRSQPSSAVAGE